MSEELEYCIPRHPYPTTPLKRIQWLEEECRIKRSWFQKILTLQDIEDVSKFSYEELIDKYPQEYFKWECACIGAIGRESIKVFAAFEDEIKLKLITFQLRNWIALRLFEKYWNWN